MFCLQDSYNNNLHPLSFPFHIGRGKSNHLKPESGSVSKNHAIIEMDYERNEISIKDLDSRHGTCVGYPPDNWSIVENEYFPIFIGQYIKLGQTTMYKLIYEKYSENKESTINKEDKIKQNLFLDQYS